MPMRKASQLLSPVFLAAGVFSIATCASADPISFRRDIAPILVAQCQACHGKTKAEGDYRVDSFARLMRAGESGDRGVAAGKPDESELFRRILSEDKDERMPAERDPLRKEKIELVRRWILEGAKFDGQNHSTALVSIIPDAKHPDPPDVYAFALPVTALAFSRDGKQLFAGGYNELTVWNPDDGSLIRRIKQQGQRTYSIALSPDGRTLATGSGTPGRLGEIRLFDAESGKLLTVLGRATDVVLGVAWSSDATQLVAVAADRTVQMYDVGKRKALWRATSHSNWVNAVAMSPDGKKVATASRDKTAKVLNAENGRLLATYSGHMKNVRGVAFHPSGEKIYTADADRVIHLWDAQNARKTKDVDHSTGEFYRLSRAGEFLFAASEDGVIRQYQASDHKKLRQFTGHTQPVFSIAFAPETSRLATGSADGEVRVWDVTSGESVLTFVAAPGYANAK